MADVFISYKRRLRGRVEQIAAILEAAGYSVWYDASLDAGERFGPEIARQVREAKCVVVCWSNDAFAHGGDRNGWVVSEASIGRDRGVYVPLLLEDADLDPPFNGDHVLDLRHINQSTSHSDPAWAQVVNAVARKAGRAAASVAPAASGPVMAPAAAAPTHAAAPQAPPASAGYGTRSYRAYVLLMLLIIYTFNFIDRILIGVLQEAIKVDLNITNLQLGLLGGPAFAILYTLLGVPIARAAERMNRITIVSIGAALWSAMTAACGLAGNFVQLTAARIGVGIGEAACSPPSHSVISDYFPPERRTSALGIFALGIPIGSALAAVGGGWLNQQLDWRTAFIALGVPGLLAALLLKLTVREPPRSGASKAPSMGATFAFLLKKPSFWHVAFGGALMSFFGYASAQFLVSLFVRNFDLGPTLRDEIANASYAFGAISGLAVGLGTFLGGHLADRLAPRHKTVLTWLPALGIAVAVPLYAVSYAVTDFAIAFSLIAVAAVFHYLYLGPMFNVTQSVCEPRMRATGAALQILIVNLIGYGLGPPLVGFANDFYADMLLRNQGLSPEACADAASAAACASAQALGLKYALGTALIALVWAAVHFLLAGRTIDRDRIS